jgi:hypothetical protein
MIPARRPDCPISAAMAGWRRRASVGGRAGHRTGWLWQPPGPMRVIVTVTRLVDRGSEPVSGFEPLACRLQDGCSAN